MTVGAHATKRRTTYSKRRRMESSSSGASLCASEFARANSYVRLALFLELALDGVAVLLVPGLVPGRRTSGLALGLRLAIL
jgi:hypothetical protein